MQVFQAIGEHSNLNANRLSHAHTHTHTHTHIYIYIYIYILKYENCSIFMDESASLVLNYEVLSNELPCIFIGFLICILSFIITLYIYLYILIVGKIIARRYIILKQKLILYRRKTNTKDVESK